MRNLALALAVLVVAGLASSSAAAADQVFTILTQGTKSGEMKVSSTKPGTYSVVYSYKNNGRGPDYKEELSVAKDGTFSSYALTGATTFGNKIEERFGVADGKATWISPSDKGEVAVTGTTGYVPTSMSDFTLALVAKAVTTAKGGKLAIVPQGELTATKIGDKKIKSKKGDVTATLWAIQGMWFAPSYVWLDKKGALFAVVYPGWYATLPADYVDVEKQLADLQRAETEKYLGGLAAKHAKRWDRPVTLTNVGVLDVVTGKITRPATVTWYGDQIATVEAGNAKPAPDSVVIDGGGGTLMPGLIDMHSHDDPWGALLNIAGGITAVRDLGNDNNELAQTRAGIDSGKLIGPRVFPSGFIEGKSDYSAKLGFVVESPEEGIEKIRWYARHGYRAIKLYNSIKPEWMKPLADEAHRLGMRVSGHVPAFSRASNAIEAGYDEIQHINQVMLGFILKDGEDTRTLARFTILGERAASVDVNGPQVKAFIDLCKKRGTTIDSTLAVFESMLAQRNGEVDPIIAGVADRLPANVVRGAKQAAMEITPANDALYKKSAENLAKLVKKLDDSGVPLVAGTDSWSGFTLGYELESYVKAGLKPERVLRMATLDAAKVLGADQRLGTVQPGKLASLVLVDGDPVKDITALRRTKLVVKEGTVFLPSELFPALGTKPGAPAPTITEPTVTAGK